MAKLRVGVVRLVFAGICFAVVMAELHIRVVNLAATFVSNHAVIMAKLRIRIIRLVVAGICFAIGVTELSIGVVSLAAAFIYNPAFIVAELCFLVVSVFSALFGARGDCQAERGY
jgi:hypothetical protein